MANYFRIVGYHPEDDFCFIADSNGKFDMIWHFSSCLVKKGIKVLEISGEDKFLDVNFSRAEENDKQIIVRATAKGKPIYEERDFAGITQKVITVGNKSYIPNRR